MKKPLKFKFFYLILFLLVGNMMFAQNPNTPMMGWSSWNTFRIDISDQLIRETADAMVAKGLKDVGYTFVNIDDGFFYGRDAQGNLLYNATKFPGGMGVVADYIHNKGLKAGIYSDGGVHTCAYQWDSDAYGQYAGMKGHEIADADLFFNQWGYDFIKLDYCGGKTLGLDEKTQYQVIYNAIQATGRTDIRFNICRWMFPGVWAADIAGSWRISQDIQESFDTDRGVRGVLDKNLFLAQYVLPGHFNDMDMMQLGRNKKDTQDPLFTVDEEKSHFGLWCIMSSPLLIGCDLRTIRQSTIDIITNPEVIAINQDVLGRQARLINKEGKRYTLAKTIEQDQGKIRAVALFNCESSAKTMTIKFEDIQLSGTVTVRDLWSKTNVGQFTDSYQVQVPAHGTAMLRLEGQSSFDKTSFEAEYAYMNEYNEVLIEEKGTYTGARFSPKFGASGNYVMKDLGKRETNWAEFRDVYSTTGGKYKLKLFYYSGTNAELSVYVNGVLHQMGVLNSGGANKRARAFIDEIELNPGYNTIRLTSTGVAPEIDKIVLLDPSDPGDDNEPDIEIDDEIIVNTKLPVISSEDASDETWYYIQFRKEHAVLQDMGEGVNLLTKQKVKGQDEQLWKITGTEGNYKIINKSGRSISLVGTLYQAAATSALTFKISATTNGVYGPGWEIQRVGQASDNSLNQDQGAGADREIAEFRFGDQGNVLLFVAQDRELNFLPAISKGNDEYWHYIRFKDGMGVLQDMGTGNKVQTKKAKDNEEGQLWKITGTKDNYQLTSKSGNSISFSNDFFETSTTPVSFKLIYTESETLAPGWELQRADVADKYMAQYPDAGLNKLLNESNTLGADNNILEFVIPSEMKFSFPQISTPGNEVWYFIQFNNGSGVIQDMGLDQDLLTKKMDKENEAQHWKVIEIENATDNFKYRIVGKNGRTISHVASTLTNDGLYQATMTAAKIADFDIVATLNTEFAPGWELFRNGSSKHLNQYTGAGMDKKISEWNKNDKGNPLNFIDVNDAIVVESVMPDISSVDNSNEIWYYINFIDSQEGTKAVLEDMGEGAPVMTKNQEKDKTEQLWKVVMSDTPTGNYKYRFISKAGRTISWNGSRYIAATSSPVNLLFNELPPNWGIEREGGTQGMGMTQTALGPNQEIKDDYYSAVGNGLLIFEKAGGTDALPGYKKERDTKVYVSNRQLIVEGTEIEKVTVYTTSGQQVESKKENLVFSLPLQGYYIIAVEYKDKAVKSYPVVL